MFHRRHGLEIREPPAQREHLGTVREFAEARVAEMRGLFEVHALRRGGEIVHAQIGHRLLRRRDRAAVQLDPAGVGQMHEAARRALQPLQIGGTQLQSLLLPFRGNRKPINAAAAHDDLRTQLARREEQPLKTGIAQILRARGPLRPFVGERTQEYFVRVAHPHAGFRREPIQPPQPRRRVVEPRVFEHLRTLVLGAGAPFLQMPFAPGPLPQALIALAAREQAQPHRGLAHLEQKFRHRGVNHAQFLPLISVRQLAAPQIRSQPRAQAAHGHRGRLRPVIQQLLGRRVAQRVKMISDQHQRGPAAKKADGLERVIRAVGQREAMRELQAEVARIQVRPQRRDLAVEARVRVLHREFEARLLAPLHEPLQQLRAAKRDFFNVRVAPGEPLGEPDDELPVARREQFLLVRRTRRQLDDLRDRPALLAGARAKQIEPHRQRVQR